MSKPLKKKQALDLKVQQAPKKKKALDLKVQQTLKKKKALDLKVQRKAMLRERRFDSASRKTPEEPIRTPKPGENPTCRKVSLWEPAL